MSLFQILNGNNYGVFNRNIAHEIGLNETLLLSEILDKYSYFKNEGQLVAAPGQEGEWFYLKAETIFQRTTLTERQQRPCIEKLVNLGFIKKISFGLPCLRHFQVCEEVIEEFIVSKIKTTRGYKKEGLSPDKSSGPDLTKCKDSPIYKRPSEETKENNNKTKEDVVVFSKEYFIAQAKNTLSNDQIEHAWKQWYLLAQDKKKKIINVIGWLIDCGRKKYNVSENKAEENREWIKLWENYFDNIGKSHIIHANQKEGYLIFTDCPGVTYNIKDKKFIDDVNQQMIKRGYPFGRRAE